MRTREQNSRSQRGQALIYAVVWMALVLAVGALALDVGWAMYSAKRSQTALDAAAIAAVTKARDSMGMTATPLCGDNVQCQNAASTCPSGGNLELACQYAGRNGVTNLGDSGRQKLTVEADDSTNPPGMSNMDLAYWVQVRSEHQLPRWFSSLFNKTGLTVKNVSTAALRQQRADASLYLLNRETDCFVSALNIGLICGEDLLMLGGNQIHADKPIHMASPNRVGLGLPQIAAATIVGVASVTAPKTYIRGKGGIQALGAYNWDSKPMNGIPDGEIFMDPMAGRGQPPVPSNLTPRPVTAGLIVGSLDPNNPRIIPPGFYYAATPALPLVPSVPLGTPITIAGHVIFSDGAPKPCGGFCDYVFHGGLITAALSSVKVAPGRYVIAGAQPIAGGPGVGLSVGANATLTDMTPLVGNEIGAPADAGEIFIFTDSNYPGLPVPPIIQNLGLTLPQARAGVTSLGLGTQVVLHGLNPNSPDLPAELRKFAPALIWQDQANTTVRYKPDGNVDNSCSGTCLQVLAVPGSQEMIMGASSWFGQPATHLWGTIYGPRQSWLTVVGLLPGDTIEGPLQVITGSLQMTLNTNMRLKALPEPPRIYTASLIQ